MAIIVDPDNLSRADVIFGTAAQQISIYPVGDTESNGAGAEFIDVWVATTGTIESGTDFAAVGTPVVAGNVVAIQNGIDAGHYYVQAISTVTLTLAEIDTGTAGAATTGLTTTTSSVFDGTSGIDQSAETITGLSGHGYVTGDALIYQSGADTEITGLTDDDIVYVNRVGVNEFSLHTTFAFAISDANRIDISNTGSSTTNVFFDRIIVQVFNNGAATVENIVGLDTSGDNDGDVRDGATLQAIYSFGKEEWRVDTQVADVDSNSYNDDLIRHQFPFEAITSEQFEVGGGTAHDNWNWFNLYTRKKVRTAGFAEKTLTGTGDLARETGIITLGSIDADAQVFFQQTSIVTPSVDFTFLGPVNEALKVYDDPSADNTPESDLTTFLKLFVRKKGRSYVGSQISDIGVSAIQTIVNRFPLAHATDTGITLSDSNLLGAQPFKFAATPVNIAVAGSQDDGVTTGGATFTSTTASFFLNGIIPGDVLEITSGNDAGFYKILTVDLLTDLTIDIFEVAAAPNFTFNIGFTDSETALTYAIYSSILTPAPGQAGVRDDGTKDNFPIIADTGIVDVDGDTGTLTDTTGTFVTDDIAVDDIVLIEESFELGFLADTEVDAVVADTITWSGDAGHNLVTGDRLVYDSGVGTDIVELVTGDVYYASVESVTRFYVCATLDDALDRANGDSTEITLTPGSTETHIFRAHELDGAYPVISRDSSTVLTLDTSDNIFPALVKPNTSYTIVEPGMYLQFKDRTIQKYNDTQTTGPLTDLDFTAPSTITIASTTAWDASIQSGDMLIISGIDKTPGIANNGRFTVLSRDSDTQLTIDEGTFVTSSEVNLHVGVTIYIRRVFELTLGSDDVSFNWQISGNGGTLQNVFEVVQEQLRSALDIDAGPGTLVPATNSGLVGFIGKINNLLMSFAAPTGTGLNLFIDNLASNDINNATFNDHGGTARNFPFTSSGNLVFNPNLTNDTNSKYWLFFTDDDAGDNLARDYGTQDAIIVNDATSPTPNAIAAFVNASGGSTHGGSRSVSAGVTSITFTFDFDGNSQRGTASQGVIAPVTLVAIGAPTAQFVIAAGSITRTTGITISAVAALERNYNGSLTP